MGMTGSFIAVDAETLNKIEEDPSLIEELLYPNEEDDPEGSVDVDKAWHGIHYVLEKIGGSESVLAQTVLGGAPFGDGEMEDFRLMPPQQVRAISAALSSLTPGQVQAAYDPVEMTKADIYPAVIWTRDGSEAFDYIAGHLDELIQYYAAAAAEGKSLVLTIG